MGRQKIQKSFTGSQQQNEVAGSLSAKERAGHFSLVKQKTVWRRQCLLELPEMQELKSHSPTHGMTVERSLSYSPTNSLDHSICVHITWSIGWGGGLLLWQVHSVPLQAMMLLSSHWKHFIFSPAVMMRDHVDQRACITQAFVKSILETHGLGVKAEQMVLNVVFWHMGQGGGWFNNFKVTHPVEIQPMCPAWQSIRSVFPSYSTPQPLAGGQHEQHSAVLDTEIWKR